jgi:hypothetical protein
VISLKANPKNKEVRFLIKQISMVKLRKKFNKKTM